MAQRDFVLLLFDLSFAKSVGRLLKKKAVKYQMLPNLIICVIHILIKKKHPDLFLSQPEKERKNKNRRGQKTNDG